MSETHSEYSASGFEAAMLCPGKVVLEDGLPDSGSKYADEGTAAHQLLSWCIEEGKPARAYLGRLIAVNGTDWPVTEEMAGAVQTAVDNIAQIAGGDAMVLSEQRVTYASYFARPDADAWGTSDIIAVRGNELQVHDYKHGQGVEVDAEDNVQMKLYGLGALVACQGILGDFAAVRLVIHQPRIKSAPSEWVIGVAELEAWGRGEARSAVYTRMNAKTIGSLPDGIASATWQQTYLRPGEKQCRFCRAKATCPALRAASLEPIFGSAPPSVDEFEDVTVPKADHIRPATAEWLSAVMSKADLIEGWLKAVRAEVERRLLEGGTVPGYKIVQGKRGNRAWSNPAEAEKLLREVFRLKVEDAYDLKLISPTSAEKLHKSGVIGPRQWPKAVALITQPDGKPSVAPVSDPRPALVLTPPADDFADVSTEPVSNLA